MTYPNLLEDFIPENDLAAIEGVTPKTMQRRRYRRESAPYVVIGRKIYYRIEAYRDWLAQRERDFSKDRQR